MLRLAALALIVLATSATAAAQPSVIGHWSGEIEGTGLTVIFHIAEADGGLATTFDVPQQGVAGLGTGETTVDADTLRITIPMIGGRFDGAIGDEAIVGAWQQGGRSATLVLTPATEDAGRIAEREDTPQPPFPYQEEEVEIVSVDGVTLAGTLTMPDGDGPVPGVVLVTGSGPQNRDSELLGHRVFLVLADHLTRCGIAVLRYDDRGVGASTGDYGTATSADFALDAQAAAAFLDTRDRVSSVFVVGHSEGGLIAPIVANALPAVDGVVLLAGPAIPGRDVLSYQLTRGAAAVDVAETSRAALRAAVGVMLDEVARGDAGDAAERATASFQEAISEIPEADRAALGADGLAAAAERLVGPWERYYIAYDPGLALDALDVPALALFGALDQQVRAEDNVPAVEAALADAPAGSEVRVLDRRNHLFQPTETGSVGEYGQIPTSFDPAMMDLVADWILAR